MFKYIVKRLLTALLILVGVSLILYIIIRLMPANVIRDNYMASHQQAGEFDEAELQAILDRYNLGDDSFGGIVTGWWKWITAFLCGDFGVCLSESTPVQKVIFDNMGVSFAISFISLLLQLIIAIPLGIKCACNQYGKLDYTVTALTMIGISFPSFFFASIIIKVFALDLGWFEPGSLISGSMVNSVGFERFINICWHMVLPIFVLTILSIGSMMRYTRTNTLEVLNADYIRTARAKGLSENKVVYKHVFRNTLIPLVTTLAGILPGLFGGSMIIEQMFSLPGIGNTAYQMTLKGDIPFIMGYDMFIATLTVLGILLTDIMYAVVDPRVKIGK